MTIRALVLMLGFALVILAVVWPRSGSVPSYDFTGTSDTGVYVDWHDGQPRYVINGREVSAAQFQAQFGEVILSRGAANRLEPETFWQRVRRQFRALWETP